MGSSSKPQTVGYRYFMGVQLALVHGPIDAWLELIAGERSAWTGNVTTSSSIVINQPELFGGDKREGGLVGQVDLMMGEPTQAVNSYLDEKIDGPVPAFRGLATSVFRNFMWSSGNPYFKAPWWRIRRVLKGWSRETTWYPAKAQIGRDMNPVHIVYECLTNLEWGMGYSPDDIDDANWKLAADKIFTENFGLSLLWMEQTTIIDFIKIVLGHIDANVRLDIKTGRFQIRLIRNDYDASLLPELNPSNVINLSSFQRSAWGDQANEVVVKYMDRDQSEVPIAVQDLAAIEAQGSLISVTREYLGIREPDLARRVAIRDLNNMSTPLAKVVLVVNRIAWDWDVTDVFKLNWPKLGISGVAFRILKITKGDLINGQITIEALEDIFGLPTNSYVAQQPSGWVDPISEPQPVVAQRAIESSYWDVVMNLPPEAIAYLPTDYGFSGTMAVRPSSDSYDYEMYSSQGGAPYELRASVAFAPSGLLTAEMSIGGSSVSFTISNATDMSMVDLDTYFYIDSEAFVITARNPTTGVITAGRAVLDTVPAHHVVGSRVYFAEWNIGVDGIARVSGETINYKAVTRTGKGTLSLALAPVSSVTLTSRATRPYPPGNLQFNAQYFPTKIYGVMTSSYANRNRLQQTVSLVPFTTGNITPEVGATTTYRIYDGAVLKRTYSGLTGTTWSYPDADALADGLLTNVRVTVEAVRGAYVSLYRHDLTIDRHGLGFHLGEELGGVAP